jgi:acyl carrier protein
MNDSPLDAFSMLSAAVTELLAERGEEITAPRPDTTLGADLGISSVDVIHLMIMLEDQLGFPLSFQELAVRDGEYADDLTLGEIAAFVQRSATAQQSASST